METVEGEKNNKTQFSLWRLSSNTTNVIYALDDFYKDYPFADWYKTTQDEGHSQYFSKKIGFWTWWLSILRMPLHTKMLCRRLRGYERLDQKWLGIHFLFLSKHDINSVLKIPAANFFGLNLANSSWVWQVCRLLKYQLCVVCGSNFSSIKIQSTSEIVFKALTLV